MEAVAGSPRTHGSIIFIGRWPQNLKGKWRDSINNSTALALRTTFLERFSDRSIEAVGNKNYATEMAGGGSSLGFFFVHV